MTTLIGKQLGKYEIIERLGQGGMAEVYKAFQPGIERYVAIKVLHPHLVHSPELVTRFLREARAIGRLHHPNIVHIIDADIAFDTDPHNENLRSYGRMGDMAQSVRDQAAVFHPKTAMSQNLNDGQKDSEECYYMVMDYIHGETLGHYLQTRQCLAVDVALQIGRQLADALAYAHEQGMVHRDVKPTNILVKDATNLEVVLTDFGLARLYDDAAIGLTISGTLVGTPTYMSPEAVRGEPCDARTDIYSLGVVLYELCTGKPPYVANTPYSMMMKLANDPLPPPRTMNPALSVAVEALLIQALSKAPSDRFASATAFATAIAQVQQTLFSTPNEQQHFYPSKPFNADAEPSIVSREPDIALSPIPTHIPNPTRRSSVTTATAPAAPIAPVIAPPIAPASSPHAPQPQVGMATWWGLILAVASILLVSIMTIKLLMIV